MSDVYTINEVLRHLNAEVVFENNQVTIDASKELNIEAPFEYVRKMRASVQVMGLLLARNGRARIALPGGCAIGSRPIDQHLKGFEAMGAKVQVGNGFVEAYVEGELKGAKIYLDFPSVGATENIMSAATLAKGTTILENAAKEPEIVDLANFLNAMGRKYAELELERFVSKALINYMVQTTLLFLTVLKREHSWLQQQLLVETS